MSLSYSGKAPQGTEQTIDFGSIGNISTQLKDTASWLTNTIDQLDNELNSQLSYWSGSAQAAYKSAHEKWKTAAQDLASVMQKIAGAVDEANTNYKQTESAVTSQFN